VSFTPSLHVHGERYQLLLRATNVAGLQTVTASKQVLMSSSHARFSVYHNNITAVSDLHELAGHVIVHNTSGFVSSITCSAGIQRYGKHITDRLVVIAPHEVMAEAKTYTISMPCGAQQASRAASLDGQDVYLTATIVFCTGETSQLSSQASRIDLSPPLPGTVQVFDAQKPYGSVFSEAHTACGRANHVLEVVWSRFIDHHSGILGYDVGIGKTKGDDSVTAFKSVGTEQAYVINTTGFSAGLYVVSVRAWNNAGLSTIASQEFVIDSSAPTFDGIIRVQHAQWGELPAHTARIRPRLLVGRLC
jgi:hypothetical protein